MTNAQAMQPAVVWEGPTREVNNRFGVWRMGEPRRDLAPEQIALLGPGFRVLWPTPSPAELDASLPEMPVPRGGVRWATAWAHWGDTIACMSIAKRLLDLKGQEQCDFVYTGPDAHIIEFLEAQPWIRRVVRGDSANRGRYLRAYSLAAFEAAPASEWYPLIQAPGLPRLRDVTPTAPSLHRTLIYRCRPLKGAALPQARVTAAEALWRQHVARRARGRRVILLHPVSVWSESAGNHWPHTKRAIAWLLENTPHLYLLTGLEKGFALPHERLVDLVDATPTCMEVFALASKCDGVISTCNGVAHWTVTQDLPGLIWGNRVMDDAGYYYRRHVDRLPNTWLNVDASFADFERTAAQWLAGLARGRTGRSGRRPAAVAA